MINSTILSGYHILIPVVKRKPILLVDESDDSTNAIDLFKRHQYIHSKDINILRTHPSVLRKFEDGFQSKVWFVEGQATDRRFIENIIFPAKLLTIHTIWLPDGSKLTKVTLTAPNMLEVRSKIERIKRIAKQIKNIELEVEFESERNNK